MSGAANAARGARAELAVVKYLQANGFPEARRSGRGFKGSDVLGVPFSVEVKDRARSAWPTWQTQAARDAGAEVPAVVVRRWRGQPDVGLWEARWTDGLDWWDEEASAWTLMWFPGTLRRFLDRWKERADVA